MKDSPQLGLDFGETFKNMSKDDFKTIYKFWVVAIAPPLGEHLIIVFCLFVLLLFFVSILVSLSRLEIPIGSSYVISQST